MAHRNASLALAIALIALGTAQASAEMITVDPSAPAYSDGDEITQILAPAGSSLPDAHLYVYPGYQHLLNPTYRTVIATDGGVRVIAADAVDGHTPSVYTLWQSQWMLDDGAEDGHALRVDFVPDVAAVDLGTFSQGYWHLPTAPSQYQTVEHVEVVLRSNEIGDWGAVQAWAADGSLLKEKTVNLSAQAGLSERVKLDRWDDNLASDIAYITASGYGGHGITVYITGLAYGDSPGPVTVPEPASFVSLLLGCVGIGLLRKRLI